MLANCLVGVDLDAEDGIFGAAAAASLLSEHLLCVSLGSAALVAGRGPVVAGFAAEDVAVRLGATVHASASLVKP